VCVSNQQIPWLLDMAAACLIWLQLSLTCAVDEYRRGANTNVAEVFMRSAWRSSICLLLLHQCVCRMGRQSILSSH
jgi:hypothetical protein